MTLMTIEKIVGLLQVHINNQQAAYSLAMARADAATAMAIDAELIESRNSMALLLTLPGR